MRELNDEDAYFEVWFQLQRRDHWKSLYGDEPFHEGWGEAFKDPMAKAWHARASFHVTFHEKKTSHPPVPIYAVILGDRVLIIGHPGVYDWLTEDDPQQHNCDAMGCNSLEHVIANVPLERLQDYPGQQS